MVFKRLWNKDGAPLPLEVDTILRDEAVLPGGMLRGEVVVRAERDLKIESIRLRLAANVSMAHKGDGDGTDDGATIGYPDARGWFEIRKGEERRIPLRHRMRWETPVNELRGEALGVSIGVGTEVEAVGVKSRTDLDPVRVGALPLHEALLDAFAAEGYALGGTRVYENAVDEAEYHLYMWQGFRLVRDGAAEGPPKELELTLHTNAVGSEIFLRKFSPSKTYWNDKPQALRFVAAHHEVGTRDFGADVRGWLDRAAVLKRHGRRSDDDEE